MSSVEPPVSVGVKSVLIAFGFSEASHKPLHHALAIARHYEGKFYLAHVVSSPGFAIAEPESPELAIGAAQRDMQQLKHDLLESGALADLHHEFIVREGKVWEQLELIIRQKQPGSLADECLFPLLIDVAACLARRSEKPTRFQKFAEFILGFCMPFLE